MYLGRRLQVLVNGGDVTLLDYKVRSSKIRAPRMVLRPSPEHRQRHVGAMARLANGIRYKPGEMSGLHRMAKKHRQLQASRSC